MLGDRFIPREVCSNLFSLYFDEPSSKPKSKHGPESEDSKAAKSRENFSAILKNELLELDGDENDSLMLAPRNENCPSSQKKKRRSQ